MLFVVFWYTVHFKYFNNLSFFFLSSSKSKGLHYRLVCRAPFLRAFFSIVKCLSNVHIKNILYFSTKSSTFIFLGHDCQNGYYTVNVNGFDAD